MWGGVRQGSTCRGRENLSCGRLVEWGEFKLGDLFRIETTPSFNKNSLTPGGDFDYITRTSQNQGILQETGFVNDENLNPSGNWSLGLLQMNFFYRQRPWYAGQFVRKITPKIEISSRVRQFFSTILNKQSELLLRVLVRDVDKTFRNSLVQLPITPAGEPDYEFMETLIRAVQKLVIKAVVDYADEKIAATREVVGGRG